MPVPQPGLTLQVDYLVDGNEFHFAVPCPDHNKIPCIPHDLPLVEYFNALESETMVAIFASMLNERRIVMTSRKLSRLTSCIIAANSLIYPMQWQHIFIPVLPVHLIDYLAAPMPFLVGVPTEVLDTYLKKTGQVILDDVVVLNLDMNHLRTPFDDVNQLPNHMGSSLKKLLNHHLKNLHEPYSGDRISRAFLRALVMLIGRYREALNFNTGSITFNSEAFLQTRPQSMRPFLERMLHLQIFQQFIENRLAHLNSGECFSDEFDAEVSSFDERSLEKFKTQYKTWLSYVKKEGGAFFKSIKPAAGKGYKKFKFRKRVKDRVKEAYADMKSKLSDSDGKLIDRGQQGRIQAAVPRVLSSPDAIKGSSSSYSSSSSSSNDSERFVDDLLGSPIESPLSSHRKFSLPLITDEDIEDRDPLMLDLCSDLKDGLGFEGDRRAGSEFFLEKPPGAASLSGKPTTHLNGRSGKVNSDKMNSKLLFDDLSQFDMALSSFGEIQTVKPVEKSVNDLASFFDSISAPNEPIRNEMKVNRISIPPPPAVQSSSNRSSWQRFE